DHVGDDRLVLPRQVLVEQFDQPASRDRRGTDGLGPRLVGHRKPLHLFVCHIASRKCPSTFSASRVSGGVCEGIREVAAITTGEGQSGGTFATPREPRCANSNCPARAA